ncbi:MAG: hypothetical protein ACTHJ0_16450, partial [Flavipsychrobacter sp.]
MKRFIQFVIVSITCCLAFPFQSKASHAAGAEITYVWKSDSTYTVYYHLYRDCSGIPEPDSVLLCYYSYCDGFSNTIYLNKTTYIDSPRLNGDDVWVACPSNPTTCHGGTLPGYQEWWYSALVTLPSRCDNWTFSHYETYRNLSILNLQWAGQPLYTEATLNN